MRNCISKISKDRLLGLEEFMKNTTSSEKGKVRPGIDMAYQENIYEDPFHEEVFKNVGFITDWCVVGRPFLKLVRCINTNLKCTMT